MNALTGTARLTRLALRRDRITLPAWLLALAGFAAATSAAFVSQYRNPAADLMQDTRLVATSPGMRLLGLASGPSVGGYAMVRDFLLLAVLAALMSTFAVVRHTRQSEPAKARRPAAPSWSARRSWAATPASPLR